MLTLEIRNSIYSQVDFMLKYLDFTECVEQINERFPTPEQIGYAISYFIKETQTCNCGKRKELLAQECHQCLLEFLCSE